MHNQDIVRVINPEITALVIPVTHFTDNLFCVFFCLFLRDAFRLDFVIFRLQYIDCALYLGFKLKLVTVVHCIFIFGGRTVGRSLDIIDGNTRKNKCNQADQ